MTIISQFLNPILPKAPGIIHPYFAYFPFRNLQLISAVVIRLRLYHVYSYNWLLNWLSAVLTSKQHLFSVKAKKVSYFVSILKYDLVNSISANVHQKTRLRLRGHRIPNTASSKTRLVNRRGSHQSIKISHRSSCRTFNQKLVCRILWNDFVEYGWTGIETFNSGDLKVLKRWMPRSCIL